MKRYAKIVRRPKVRKAAFLILAVCWITFLGIALWNVYQCFALWHNHIVSAGHSLEAALFFLLWTIVSMVMGSFN